MQVYGCDCHHLLCDHPYLREGTDRRLFPSCVRFYVALNVAVKVLNEMYQTKIHVTDRNLKKKLVLFG